MKVLIDTNNPAIIDVMSLVCRLDKKIKEAVDSSIGSRLFWIISTDRPSDPNCDMVRVEAIITRSVRTISVGYCNGFAEERTIEAAFYAQYNHLDVGKIGDISCSGSLQPNREDEVLIYLLTNLKKVDSM